MRRPPWCALFPPSKYRSSKSTSVLLSFLHKEIFCARQANEPLFVSSGQVAGKVKMRTLLREAESRRIQAEAKAKRAERNAAATTVELDALRADCTPHNSVLSLSSRLEEQEYLFLDDRISERAGVGFVCVQLRG